VIGDGDSPLVGAFVSERFVGDPDGPLVGAFFGEGFDGDDVVKSKTSGGALVL
jgi:hypothetical protein